MDSVSPFGSNEEIAAITDNLLDGGFTEGEVRQTIAFYFGMISFMDAQVGRVLDALANSPYADNTRIIYTSDHGDMLGEHGMWFKGTMHEGSAGIPMILAGPIRLHRRIFSRVYLPLILNPCGLGSLR